MRTRTILFLLTALIVRTGPLVIAAEQTGSLNMPQVRLPLMSTAPTIDGLIAEDEWADAARMERFCSMNRQQKGMLTGGEATYWVGSDGEKIFIAVSSETRPGGVLTSKVQPAPEGGDARTFIDDSVEMVLDPPWDESGAEPRRMYHAIFNANGAIYDQARLAGGGGEAWRADWEIANVIDGDNWYFECAIPIADLRVEMPVTGKPFGIRLGRNWNETVHSRQTQWAPAPGLSYLNRESLPVVIWDPAAPVIQHLGLRDPDDPSTPMLRVSAANPGDAPVTATVRLELRPANSAHTELERDIVLAPGDTQVLNLRSVAAPEETIEASILVTSPNRAKTYYLRDFNWTPARPAPFFRTGTDDARKVAFDFAYYPSVDTIRLRVDVSALEQKREVTTAMVQLRTGDGKQILAETTLDTFVNHLAVLDAWRVPDLPEGDYELVATLSGLDVEPVVAEFSCQSFPWEGNTIGKSDRLIPPYTPIEVTDNMVATILRHHRLNGVGLWDQVEALGEELLAGPMHLEVVVDGNQHVARGEELEWTKTSATQATATGAWSAGPVHGQVSIVWDYDGLMQWRLVVAPSDTVIDAMRLVVPLKDKACPLMHACTDGIRFNYAGKVPEGSGRVWGSDKAARNSIIGSFVPYLWVGAEGRGFCIAGENDAGWVTTGDVPCQELRRDGDELRLVCNLIAKPAPTDAPRLISLAFQATPVKPMPQDWRLKTFSDWRAAAVNDPNHHLAFLGSCYYWGAETPSRDHYPRNRDFTYLEKMAETRRTGVVDEAFIKRWLEGYDKIIATAGDNEQKRRRLEDLYQRHVDFTFRLMQGQPDKLCMYTNPRGARFDLPDGQTFINEWNRNEFVTRDWGYGAGVAYDVTPVPSFRDFSTWQLRRMAEIVLDSVYWDNVFPQSNFNTSLTAAYRRPDGAIQPSAGIFEMREHIRRIGVMYVEMDRPVMNIAHMTNTAVTPVLSFAQMNYTWEDKGGADDFQDRYSRDYIRAESIGLQQGNIPIALWLVYEKDPIRLRQVERSGVGVALTHEIKIAGSAEIFWDTYKTLRDFGYGRPEVNVSRYWDGDHPVAVEGLDVTSLVMSKKDAAMILVCDWGGGGEGTLHLDAGQFKSDTLPWRAVDAETGAPLIRTADNAFRFQLEKHDFKLIAVNRQPEERILP